MSDTSVNVYNFLHNVTASESFWLVFFACVVFLTVIVWLLLRGARLWYWKVNLQVDALKSIDQKLNEIGQDLKVNIQIPTEESEITEITDAEIEETVPEKPIGEQSVGKSGKVYTEDELELLIKD